MSLHSCPYGHGIWSGEDLDAARVRVQERGRVVPEPDEDADIELASAECPQCGKCLVPLTGTTGQA